MPHYASQEDAFSSNSHFLSPGIQGSRKAQNISTRKSSASLRPPPSMDLDDDDAGGAGRHHSLAHELAVALMPEPSVGSKLLAEEFGIEYDEGAEGIDEVPTHTLNQLNGTEFASSDQDVPSLASEIGTSASDASFHDLPPSESEDLSEHFKAHHMAPQDHSEFDDPVFSSPTAPKRRAQPKKPEQDAMEVLAQDLESTDKFLNHLRTIDSDATPSSSQQTRSVEKIASDMIRRMNDSVRERESQVRELLECEREFRKISGEVGGNEVLGMLDELTGTEELSDTHHPELSKASNRQLESVSEEPTPRHRRQYSQDWELDPDRQHLGDEEDEVYESAVSPSKASFPPPPPLVGPPTPANTVPQLAHLRTFTTSLVSHLTTLSEHAQVNGAATAEAGRKIRALKNKLGGWRTDWDSAERSRQRIEKWEAGIVEGDSSASTAFISSNTTSPGRITSKRVDGRLLVQEHLRAFEVALVDAAMKTQAIMAR
ncbi:hypothetical protein CPB83DRAFT_848556 [Crepidotus variabilis]|uniref:Uncharacterized protein n=1 Tax=Crepidotus variabilis TaxID=179855 RepID=A0A9P6EKY0_9AGAR|nr:hypothetical protein CPB83DRAFT_848556 [Crepidotus variabilis]